MPRNNNYAPVPFVGPGLRQFGGVPYAPTSVAPPGTALVYITSTQTIPANSSAGSVALGGGNYQGRIVAEPDATVDVTADLSAPALGNTSSGTIVYVQNPAEAGTSGHTLPLNTSPGSYVFARPFTVSMDGNPVYQMVQGGASDFKEFTLVNDGGSDATVSSAATYTYQLIDDTGNIIARRVPVGWARPFALKTASASRGLCRYVPGATGNGYATTGSGGGSGSGSGSGGSVQPWRLMMCDESYGQRDSCSAMAGGSGSGSASDVGDGSGDT